jgi:hypothetical protein
MRTLQEMMGHRDFRKTLIYADYAPSAHEAEWIEAAFRSPTSELAIGGRPGVTDEEPSDSGGSVKQPLDRPLEARGLIVE